EEDAEGDDEEDRRHELGNGSQREARERDRAVREPAAPQSGRDAAENRQRDDEHERLGGQLERVDERRAEQAPDRHLVLERLAHVAVDEVPDPAPVLREQRPVRADLVVEQVEGLLRRERPEDVAADVTREELRRREDDDAQDEKRYER